MAEQADALAHEFMGEVNDKYYPQVMEGLDLMESGQLAQGLEAIARPLHTIKGVSGFMSGFEEASRHTHLVESFMKKLQSGDLPAEPAMVGLAVEAVNSVFGVLEALYQGQGLEATEAGDILQRLESAKGEAAPEAPSPDGAVRVEWKDEGLEVIIGISRLHLPRQREKLLETLRSLPEGTAVRLNLGSVDSIGSSTLEELETMSQALDIRLAGLNPAARGLVYAWGFDKRLPVVDGEPAAADKDGADT